VRLLSNENLLNTFVHIIITKTNLYDSSSLIRSIELIDHFLGSFGRQKRKLPSTFIYPTLYEVAKIILSGEHCFAIVKVNPLYYSVSSVALQ